MIEQSSHRRHALSSDGDASVPFVQPVFPARKTSVVKSLDVEQPVQNEQNDKQALERFLKLGIADRVERGQSLNLETNEELPRLIPILFAYFSRDELTELIGEAMTTRMADIQRAEVVQNLYLEGELQQLLSAFNEAEIPLMLFKGPALAYSVYSQPHLRTYHDIDALVRSADLQRARDLLSKRGYAFYEEYRANVINDKRTGYNYILKQRDSWLEILIELHTAPHDSELGASFAIEDMWANAQQLTILGEPTLTMHPTDHLLYLCWHYRFHAFSRLLWLYDIVMLTRSFPTTYDWTSVIQKARKQHMATTVYYCLSWCRDLFGVSIPETVFARLRPPLACQVIVERYALSDVVKALATPAGQSRRVLAQRAMVDTTAGLLKAGARVLFPSRAMIGQRYMEHSRLPLRLYYLYYLIHPWITVSKGVRYLLKLGFHRSARVSK